MSLARNLLVLRLFPGLSKKLVHPPRVIYGDVIIGAAMLLEDRLSDHIRDEKLMLV